MRRGSLAWSTCLLLILSACSASSAAVPSENPTAPATTPTASTSVGSTSASPAAAGLDGDWVLWVKGQSSCPDLDGRRLQVAAGVATISIGVVGWSAPVPLSGPATMDGSRARIHVERSEPTKDALDLDGMITAHSSTIAGKGAAGGVHPGGQNGYACTFTFFLERIGADLADSCTTPAVQAAVLDAKGMTPVRVDPDSVTCAEGWATARVDPAHAGQEFAVALKSEEGRWVRHTMSEACNWKHPETGARPLPRVLARSVCGG